MKRRRLLVMLLLLIFSVCAFGFVGWSGWFKGSEPLGPSATFEKSKEYHNSKLFGAYYDSLSKRAQVEAAASAAQTMKNLKRQTNAQGRDLFVEARESQGHLHKGYRGERVVSEKITGNTAILEISGPGGFCTVDLVKEDGVWKTDTYSLNYRVLKP